MKCKQIKGWSYALLDTKASGNIRQSVNLDTTEIRGGKKNQVPLYKKKGESQIFNSSKMCSCRV